MRKRTSVLLAILLVITVQMVTAPPVQAGTGNAAPIAWSSKWEPRGNDWKVVFLIPKNSRGYTVQSSKYTENLVVSGSTFSERVRYDAGRDKVTMTTGYRARAWMRYEIFPHSDAKLYPFACSVRIYYWW